MSDTLITIIGVIAVALIMFVFPVMAIANQNDAITKTSVQAILSEFVNTAAQEGKITANNYDQLVQKLGATGNTYSVAMEVQHIDDNPGNKGSDAVGSNISYSVFTNDIEKEITSNGEYKLNKGDRIKAEVQNTNVTFGTQMKNFIYSIIGKDTIAIKVDATALVQTTK